MLKIFVLMINVIYPKRVNINKTINQNQKESLWVGL